MAGKNSGCMMWAGSNYEYNGINCTFTGVFELGAKYEKKVDTAISWFTDEKTPANLVMIYFDEPDEHSHRYGHESPEVSDIILFSHNKN